MTRTVIVCRECDHEVPCYHMDRFGNLKLDKDTLEELRKESVLRCPNASDSCTYPDCSHTLPEKETPEMFTRKTSGSPEAAIRDIVKTMTYKELTSMARDLGVEAHILDGWASGNFSAQPLTKTSSPPVANNDNQQPVRPTETPTTPAPLSVSTSPSNSAI